MNSSPTWGKWRLSRLHHLRHEDGWAVDVATLTTCKAIVGVLFDGFPDLDDLVAAIDDIIDPQNRLVPTDSKAIQPHEIALRILYLAAHPPAAAAVVDLNAKNQPKKRERAA